MNHPTHSKKKGCTKKVCPICKTEWPWPNPATGMTYCPTCPGKIRLLRVF